MSVVRAVLVPVAAAATAVELREPGLHQEVRRLLGGHLERFACFPLDGEGRVADCWCNEDGWALKLTPNRYVLLPWFCGVVAGPVVITVSDQGKGETHSLTDGELQQVIQLVAGWPSLQ